MREKIDRTHKEKLLFNLLRQVILQFDLHTELRVVGGWVRDKLLGKEDCHICVALNNMNGKEFCDRVNVYLSSQGEAVRKITVIRSKSPQSKHLQTTRIFLFDMCIDFVNFRLRDYADAESSCVPGMKFGIAEDYASLREFTINSLVYNINTSSVEDFTGKGIQDIKSGKIATTIHPKKIFLDDPVQVLQAIRLCTHLGFKLDEELKRAASDDDVKYALTFRTRRERVGHEVDLMMTSGNPVEAITHISDLKLFRAVFRHPVCSAIISPPLPDGYDRLCVTHMDNAWKLMHLVGFSTFNDEQRRLALYAALFLPFRNSAYFYISEYDYPVVRYMFRASLRLKFSDGEMVKSLHSASDNFLSLIRTYFSLESLEFTEIDFSRKHITGDQQAHSSLRVSCGVILRAIKDLWRVALLLSILLYDTGVDSIANSLDVQLKIFHTVEDLIKVLDLEKIWETKPLLNGEVIMRILDIEIGGPGVGEMKQKMLEWQLAHPSGTAEQCILWMKETYSTLRKKVQLRE